MHLNSYFIILIFLETVECSETPWFKFHTAAFKFGDHRKR